MAKKIVSIRIEDETLNYLKKISIKKGIHHKLSKDIPNVTRTILKLTRNTRPKQARNIHGFGSFLGDHAQGYAAGGWNAQNWKNKLKQAENKLAPGYPPARPRKKTHEENMREAAKLLGIDYDNNPFKNI